MGLRDSGRALVLELGERALCELLVEAVARAFEPDFFFDDQTGHIQNAAEHVPSGHVAAGIRNA